MIFNLMKPVPVQDVELDEPTATMYSYNGTVLPALPEWDKTAYPYAVIYYYPGIYGFGDYYNLIISSMPASSTDMENTAFDNDGTWIVYKTTSKDKPWELSEQSSVPYKNLKWANYDVYKGDGSLVLNASEPAPYYDMETLFDGEVTFTKRVSGEFSSVHYQFVGLNLNATDYKTITLENTVFVDTRFSGKGNLGNAELYDKAFDLTFNNNPASDWWYIYFDEQGSLWIVYNNESGNDATIHVTIAKQILG